VIVIPSEHSNLLVYGLLIGCCLVCLYISYTTWLR